MRNAVNEKGNALFGPAISLFQKEALTPGQPALP